MNCNSKLEVIERNLWNSEETQLKVQTLDECV